MTNDYGYTPTWWKRQVNWWDDHPGLFMLIFFTLAALGSAFFGYAVDWNSSY